MRSRALMLVAAVCCTVFAVSADTESPADQCLSPYFLVDSDDPSLDRLPLKHTDVTVTVSGVIADVTVRQRYTNEGTRPINASYIFPASTRAAVRGLTMTIGENVIQAVIKEREAAKQVFEQAKQEGKSASLLEQQRPNVFSMSVANVMPGDTIDLEMRYTELLVPTDGAYELVYPTVVGPRYSTQPAHGAPDTEAWVGNPYLHEGTPPTSTLALTVDITTGIPLQQLVCATHQVDIDWHDQSSAHVKLASNETHGGNRDIILRYRLTGSQIQSGLMLAQGESENHFLLMVQPPERVAPELIPPREYIFVVDVSGSMHGFPLDVSKRLLADLITNLRPTDRFNAILFAGGSSIMAPVSLPATAANVKRARDYIDRQEGGGGTQLAAALRRALALPGANDIARSIVVVTDGFIAAETEAFELIHDNRGTANVFAFGIGSSVNRYLIEGIARAGGGEPFVVTKPQTAGAAARKFRTYVELPLLTGIELSSQGFDIYDIEPRGIADMLAARPIVVCGKWRGKPDGTLTVTGTTGQGQYTESFAVSTVEPLVDADGLRYLWARSRVAALSDWNFGRPDEEQTAEITRIGLDYSLLTRYTSFVAVHQVVRTEPGSSTDVKQPLPLPQGVSDLAVGVTKTPEPELLLLLGLLSLPLLCSWYRRRRVRLAEVRGRHD